MQRQSLRHLGTLSAFMTWSLIVALTGCGSATLDTTCEAGQGGSDSQSSSAGGTGGAGTGGAGGATGTGGAQPGGALCSEVTVTSWSCTPNNYHDPLVSFVANSSIIFRGTVTALNETTPGINLADKSRAIIVKVDNALYTGGMLDVTGQSVTVQLLSAPTMAVGYEGYFFTSVWTLGQSIGVNEIAHIDPGVYPTIETDVPGIEELLADERLFARMQTAGSVIVGTVSAITPIPSMGPVSEHDPLWVEATIDVECALRGTKLTSASVAFASSDDVAWFASPKLTVGQKGIFLLQPAPSPPGSWPLPDAIPYVVTSALDVQDPAERDHLATLVLCPPSH